MKRPVLKRVVKTVEIVSWTLEYEDVPAEELVEGTVTAVASPPDPSLLELTSEPPAQPKEKLEL